MPSLLSTKPLLETLGPIDRTPGIPGSDNKEIQCSTMFNQCLTQLGLLGMHMAKYGHWPLGQKGHRIWPVAASKVQKGSLNIPLS